MAGECSFKEKQWEVSLQMQKKLNQEKFSTSVTNAPTLCQLIEPMDVLPSSWVHTKHGKELLTAHLLKRNKNITVPILSVMFDGELVDTLISEDHCGERMCFFHQWWKVESSLKFLRIFMLMLSFYEFRWQPRARKWMMDSSQNRWGRTSHQEPRISSWALNPSLCVWLSAIIGSGITGKRSAISPSVAL